MWHQWSGHILVYLSRCSETETETEPGEDQERAGVCLFGGEDTSSRQEAATHDNSRAREKDASTKRLFTSRVLVRICCRRAVPSRFHSTVSLLQQTACEGARRVTRGQRATPPAFRGSHRRNVELLTLDGRLRSSCIVGNVGTKLNNITKSPKLNPDF